MGQQAARSRAAWRGGHDCYGFRVGVRLSGCPVVSKCCWRWCGRAPFSPCGRRCRR